MILGVALLAGSVASLGAAGTFYFLSLDDEGGAQSAPRYDDYLSSMQSARTRQRVAAVLAGAGVLLGAGAALQWLTSGRAPDAAAWVDGRGGGGLVVGGRY